MLTPKGRYWCPVARPNAWEVGKPVSTVGNPTCPGTSLIRSCTRLGLAPQSSTEEYRQYGRNKRRYNKIQKRSVDYCLPSECHQKAKPESPHNGSENAVAGRLSGVAPHRVEYQHASRPKTSGNSDFNPLLQSPHILNRTPHLCPVPG